MTETNITHNRYDGGYKKRSDVHLARKIWHMCGVFMLFMVWHFSPFWFSLTFLVGGWLLFVPGDFMRLQNPQLNKKLMQMFRPIIRSNEVDRLAGTTYLLTGVILIAVLFPKAVVSLSLLFLAFADPIASYVGIRYGKDKIFGHKSVQGFMAAFVVCAAVTYTYLYLNNVYDYILVMTVAAGLVGALSELIPVAKIDDNFTMPVLSSVGLVSLFYFFNVFQYLK